MISGTIPKLNSSSANAKRSSAVNVDCDSGIEALRFIETISSLEFNLLDI